MSVCMFVCSQKLLNLNKFFLLSQWELGVNESQSPGETKDSKGELRGDKDGVGSLPEAKHVREIKICHKNYFLILAPIW